MSRRYIGRETGSTRYQNHNLHSDNGYRFPQSEISFRATLRLSHTEFRELLRLFGGDDVFQSHGRRKQAPVELQMAVGLYRLAHGCSMEILGDRFNLP